MKFKVTSINRCGSSLFMSYRSEENNINIQVQHCHGENVSPAHRLDDVVEINVNATSLLGWQKV